MSDKAKTHGTRYLIIDYGPLGTINIDELAHAIVEDIKALKNDHNVRYVRAPRLKFCPSDEYGDEVSVRRPAGGSVNYMRTLHFRPACKDYEL